MLSWVGTCDFTSLSGYCDPNKPPSGNYGNHCSHCTRCYLIAIRLYYQTVRTVVICTGQAGRRRVVLYETFCKNMYINRLSRATGILGTSTLSKRPLSYTLKLHHYSHRSHLLTDVIFLRISFCSSDHSLSEPRESLVSAKPMWRARRDSRMRRSPMPIRQDSTKLIINIIPLATSTTHII